MNTFSTEELDREEIEFLPPRVVMTTCNPRPSCYQPCAPKPVCPPPPCIEVCADVKVDCLVRATVGIKLF